MTRVDKSTMLFLAPFTRPRNHIAGILWDCLMILNCIIIKSGFNLRKRSFPFESNLAIITLL